MGIMSAGQLGLFPPRVLSYGGGLDSWAMLLLAAQQRDMPDAVVFIDVGDTARQDPGEWPSTYRHIRDVVEPFCRRHRVPFHVIDGDAYPVRGARSLFAWLEGDRGEGKPRANVQIPVGGPNRICTRVAKVERFEAWLSDRYPDQDVEVWIGFEAGEESRAEKDPNAGTGRPPQPGEARRRNRFPLMENGFCRCRCEELARASGHPVPRKSACTFCPYASKGDWQTLHAEQPATFDRVAELERSKPPTAKGKKLSIMGFRTMKDAAGNEVGYKAPPLPEYVAGTYRAKVKPCAVCGAADRATKATGCTYLEEGSAA
jgi:hypothetical protein